MSVFYPGYIVEYNLIRLKIQRYGRYGGVQGLKRDLDNEKWKQNHWHVSLNSSRDIFSSQCRWLNERIFIRLSKSKWGYN